MSDKELLELAAKAAGMPHKWIPLLGKMVHIIDGGRSEEWNPLTDDGDALRLVVRLKQLGLWKKPATALPLDGWAEDPYAATRRAIVRAAAEIGKVSDE